MSSGEDEFYDTLARRNQAHLDRALNCAHRAFERDYGVCWAHVVRDCPDCAARRSN